MSEQIELGFVDSKPVQWLNVDKDVVTGFCTWDKTEKMNVPVKSNTLSGYVSAVTEKDKEFKGKPVPKLNFEIKAGEDVYVIGSGRNTVFSQSLIYALETLRVQAEGERKNLSDIPVQIRAKHTKGDDVYIVAQLSPLEKVGNLDPKRSIFVKDIRDEVAYDDAVRNVIAEVGSFDPGETEKEEEGELELAEDINV